MITLLALSLLVILHELGHFVAAKLFGVRVLEFGVGIPPKVWTIAKKGHTEYTLNILPLGGFVRLYGEQGEMSWWDKISDVKSHEAFALKPAWQRAIILLAGIGVNLLIGVLLFSIVYTVVGVPRTGEDSVVMTQVVTGSPADVAGMKTGDVVVRVGEREVASSYEFVSEIGAHKGEVVNVYVAERLSDGSISDSSRVIAVTPRINPPEGEGSLGVVVATIPEITYEKKPWYVAPFYGAVEGIKESYLWGKEIASGIVALFRSLAVLKVPEGLAGPIGVVKVGSQVSDMGIIAYIRFVAIISINLGIFNLFPIPALDGGRILLLIVEQFVGKKRIGKVERYVNGVGFTLLIGLLLLVSWMDIARIVVEWL